MELTGRTGAGGASGHSSAVHGVDFGGSSPARLVADTASAVTGSKDGSCKVWNVNVRYRQNEDPKCTLTIEQPDKRPISHVAISRGKTAKYVATWSASAGLIFWALPSGTQVSVISAEDSGQVFHMECSKTTTKGRKMSSFAPPLTDDRAPGCRLAHEVLVADDQMRRVWGMTGSNGARRGAWSAKISQLHS